MAVVRGLRSRAVVAFDAAAVAGASLTWGLGGGRVRSTAQEPLPEGALVPSPLEPNLRRPEQVVAALRRVSETLQIGQGAVCLVLPDGLARLVLVEAPPGVPPQEYARYRLLPGLPYPAGEAVIDVLPAGPRRVLAAVLRRTVVEAYEAAAAEAGLVQERLDLAPLAALAALDGDLSGEATVDVILGDAAVSLAARQGASLRAFRNRRRDPGPGEVGRLCAEVARMAAQAGPAPAARVRVVGAGAAALIGALTSSGTMAEPGWRLEGQPLPAGGAELAWLGAALG